MKKIFFVLNAVLIAAISVGNYFFITIGGRDIKAATSAGFVLLGLCNLVYAVISKCRKPEFCGAMACSFLLSMLGDIVINSDFIIGAALFALGHIAFFAGYCILQRPRKTDFVIIAAIFLPLAVFVIAAPMLVFEEPVLKWVCVIYALIISCMIGKAAGNFTREKTLPNGLLLAGAVLFALSDFALLLAWFSEAGRWSDVLCMGTYYPAQCLLGHAVYQYVNKEKNQCP